MSEATGGKLVDQLTTCVDNKINAGCLRSTRKTVSADLQLPEEQEATLELLRETLNTGELQLDQGQGIDGERFMNRMIG